MQGNAEDITELLTSWQSGDRSALDRLLPLIQRELDRIARRHLARERKGHSMQPSSLVQEAFIRLLPGRDLEWRDRAHFFALSAKLMRRILVDFGRARRARKRGGVRPVHLEESAALGSGRSADVVALDEALEKLAATDPRKSQIVELRFFGGLTVDETAEVLNIGPSTVDRDFELAKLWLLRHFEREHRS